MSVLASLPVSDLSKGVQPLGRGAQYEPEEAPTVRIATYTRISTDEEHQPFSLEAQATRLGSYVDSQGDWSLVRRFSDQVSGATLERPGLRKALLEAKAGRYDLLLVYRVDRLSRSVRGLAQILDRDGGEDRSGGCGSARLTDD